MMAKSAHVMMNDERLAEVIIPRAKCAPLWRDLRRWAFRGVTTPEEIKPVIVHHCANVPLTFCVAGMVAGSLPYY